MTDGVGDVIGHQFSASDHDHPFDMKDDVLALKREDKETPEDVGDQAIPPLPLGSLVLLKELRKKSPRRRNAMKSRMSQMLSKEKTHQVQRYLQ